MRQRRGHRQAVRLAGAGGLVLIAALVLDAARLYAVRSELRAFTEASALAAALELDGTLAGFDRARSVLLRRRQDSALAARLVKQVEAEFGESPQGPWRIRPEPQCSCAYVRVWASAQVPLVGLAPLVRGRAEAVHASAVAAGSPLKPAAWGARGASNDQVGYFTQP